MIARKTIGKQMGCIAVNLQHVHSPVVWCIFLFVLRQGDQMNAENTFLLFGSFSHWNVSPLTKYTCRSYSVFLSVWHILTKINNTWSEDNALQMILRPKYFKVLQYYFSCSKQTLSLVLTEKEICCFSETIGCFCCVHANVVKSIHANYPDTV